MSRQAKLTAGPITAQLVRLCLPLLAANVLQQLYNIINSLVVTRHIGGDAFAALGASYLRLMGCFYFLSFMGHSYVGHYRGIGRMNITFWGTTLQIAVRVVLTYALAGAMGLDAVALATGLGWVAIVLFHSTVFLLELKGIGFRLPTRDEDSQPG